MIKLSDALRNKYLILNWKGVIRFLLLSRLLYKMEASQKSSGEIDSSLIPDGAFNIDEFMNAPLAI